MQRFLALVAVCAGLLHADTVLVLPFFNHTKTPSLEWIGESVAETVADAIFAHGQIVLERADRLEAYRRLSLRPGSELTHASIIKLGESLDASQIVYGWYDVTPVITTEPGKKPSKGALHITARIIDLKHVLQVPEYSELGAMEELAAQANHLGWQTVKTLFPKTAPAEDDFRKAHPPVRIDALESYVRGLLASSPEQRFRYFSQAIRLDPNYSQPHFQLGRFSWEKKDYRTAAGWFDKVRPYDSHYMEAQFFLGLCRYQIRDFAGAEQALRAVVAAVPLNEVYNNLGAVQLRRNNYDEAAASFQKAIEGDSTEPDFHFNLGYTLWRAGRYAAAADAFRAVLDRDAQDQEATSMLGRALKNEVARQGDPKTDGRERIKTTYEETVYLQLQAELGLKK